MLFTKGLEVEMYTGTPQGDVIGLSDRIVHDLEGFVREPDNRNVEYTTAPYTSYDRLLCAILKPRKHLRDYLQKLGNYTVFPDSTLSLGDTSIFHRSDPNNPYHDYIENTYHTTVVTASIHINIGYHDPEELIRALRLIRVEAPLYLALSASSPFLDNKPTGNHSSRWQVFPKTPRYVPLFEHHDHFIEWTNQQLELGTMQNVRHLWSSVRPNGDRRPYNINRLELRICDLVANPITLLAIIALLEARLIQFQKNPSLDPLISSQLTAEELVDLTDKNESLVAQSSLSAMVNHWQDGRSILMQDWISNLYDEVYPIAKENGFACFLTPIKRILREGNTAQQWLNLYHQGYSIRQIITQAIRELEQQEYQLEDKLCQAV